MLGILPATSLTGTATTRPTGSARRWLTPSLADILFIAQLIWLMLFTISSDGTAGLLIDSNTGYHIRTGDWILSHGSVPRGDIFSFSKPGQPWFAWEWLSAVLFSLTYRSLGMKGLAILTGAVIALANIVLLRHMAWRGANFLMAIGVMHLGVAAASLHYLARPHVFTFLFLAIALWLIDADRARPSPRIWLLVPMTVLWTNLHAGFLALIVSLAILSAASALTRAWAAARRYGALAAACLLASGANPYGFAVHAHALPYLRARWILELVQEFQSPNFQSTGAIYFEILLLAGAALSAALLARKEIPAALLILAWAHAALNSVRHIPIYSFVCAPFLAVEATALWNRWTLGAKRGSLRAILDSMANDHTPSLRRSSVWMPLAVLLLLLLPAGASWPTDFPSARYPAAMTRNHADVISTSRIFTTDGWADYLTFHYYPRQKIFVDGRSDFFGQEISEDYLTILRGQFGWNTLLKRYDLNAALVPPQSAIASLLRVDSGWRLIDQDSQAVLFRRVD